ncbi:hypothetical protein [Telmatospirillum sp.]|uniref:hypothetical protein n=1 Tax=Telmatospirillum sp. TaxID=2079197 RepID=UPI002851446D|nr:hypothetical protein [Telmatospirillum sp.]MDR3436205.1 hypothetical protein [Telmatospirillum sp.]
MGRFSRASERVRQILGIAVIAAVAAIALRLDTGILSRISYASTATFEQSVVNLLHANAAVDASSEAVTSATTLTAAESKQPFRSDSPAEGRVPSLDGAVAWLNSPPLTTQQLRGKVVLVDFWTYSCINCIRTLPNVSAWPKNTGTRA